MCRWLAYYGDPIPIEVLVLRRQHSLIDQSLHSRDAGADPTNGDGFGVGWYDELGGMPGLYKSIQPAWNDRNLRELATAYLVAALLRAHPSIHRHGRPGDEFPSVPAWPLALHAQRVRTRVSTCAS